MYRGLPDAEQQQYLMCDDSTLLQPHLLLA